MVFGKFSKKNTMIQRMIKINNNEVVIKQNPLKRLLKGVLKDSFQNLLI